jgi:hypothetical protein
MSPAARKTEGWPSAHRSLLHPRPPSHGEGGVPVQTRRVVSVRGEGERREAGRWIARLVGRWRADDDSGTRQCWLRGSAGADPLRAGGTGAPLGSRVQEKSLLAAKLISSVRTMRLRSMADSSCCGTVSSPLAKHITRLPAPGASQGSSIVVLIETWTSGSDAGERAAPLPSPTLWAPSRGSDRTFRSHHPLRGYPVAARLGFDS